MTNEQIATALVTFIVANAATVFAIAKWGVGKAIRWTHMERDILELQKFREDQIKTNEKNETDHKGLSMKLDKVLDKQK